MLVSARTRPNRPTTVSPTKTPTCLQDVLAANRTVRRHPPLLARKDHLTARRMPVCHQLALTLNMRALIRPRLSLSILSSSSTETARLTIASTTCIKLHITSTSAHPRSPISCRILSTTTPPRCPRQAPAPISPLLSRLSSTTQTEDPDLPPLMPVDGLVSLFHRCLRLLFPVDPYRAFLVSSHRVLSSPPPARPQCPCPCKFKETPFRALLLPIQDTESCLCACRAWD